MKREEWLVDQRTTLEYLKKEGDAIEISEEVNPELEANAIAKALDEGPAIVMNNIKGYPNSRYVANLLGKKERVAKILGVDDFKKTKFKLLDAIKHPLPRREVQKAPCQEVVIRREDVDPFALFPMVKQTPDCGGRFFGSGVDCISGKYVAGGSQLAFYRKSFRGKDYSSINMVPGGHGDLIVEKFHNEKIPITVNICPPPTVELTALGTMIPSVFSPEGIDELGIAGALQGFPVDVVKAKTVDALAVANAEMVIEGYVVPWERVWETEEAEKMGRQGVTPLHPEWARYLGRAYRTPRKFEVTAVTMRKDKPLYMIPGILAFSAYGLAPFMLACWYEMAERLAPGFVIDVNTFMGLTIWSGVVFQVKKRRRSDEGMQRNILGAALNAIRGIRVAMVVDEDVNIYSAEDLIWALTTRTNPKEDIIFGVGARGHSFQPSERIAAGAGAGATTPTSIFEGGIGIDATVPLIAKDAFFRGHYAVDKIDLKKWFTEEQIRSIKNGQSEYFRFLGEMGLP